MLQHQHQPIVHKHQPRVHHQRVQMVAVGRRADQPLLAVVHRGIFRKLSRVMKICHSRKNVTQVLRNH